ncbi:MAG: 2,3-diaminopropionate biosynthesis protein SbnA [Gammaproteobacteria bacterium]|nr:2,3-diaminopropionate biosynthesis protein SbnA [Gammaproteobacteria bacterium]
MPVFSSVLEMNISDAYFDLNGFLDGCQVFLKLEGLNPAKSIKFKTAVRLIADLERQRKITPGVTRIIESSSGNLGVALSIVCAERGYEFTCVVDPNVSGTALRLMRVYGASIVMVHEQHGDGGYLAARIRTIERLLRTDDRLVWTNQYASRSNMLAHLKGTAAEVWKHFPDLDFLFVGAGSTGTLMGCAEYKRRYRCRTRLVAVEPEGSILSGGPAGERFIPGLGTSVRPPIFDPAVIDVWVKPDERMTVDVATRVLEETRLLIGGSTATVLAGVRLMEREIPSGSTIVVISPDFGDAYLETIYSRSWVDRTYGAPLVAPPRRKAERCSP